MSHEKKLCPEEIWKIKLIFYDKVLPCKVFEIVVQSVRVNGVVGCSKDLDSWTIIWPNNIELNCISVSEREHDFDFDTIWMNN